MPSYEPWDSGSYVWYSVELTTDQNIMLTLTWVGGGDLDMYMSPDGCQHSGGYPENAIEDAISEELGATPEAINWDATSSGTFYILIRVYDGSGSQDYTLTSNVVLTKLYSDAPCGPDPTMIIGIVIGVVVVLAIVIGVAAKAKSGSKSKSYGSSYKGYSSTSTSSQYAALRGTRPPSYSGTPSYSSTPSYSTYSPTPSRTGGMFSDLDSTPSTPSTGTPYSVDSAPVSGKKKVCPKCGVEWGPEAIFCGDCGHKFT